MSETKTNPVVRLLPSLGDFAFLMPLVFLFGRMEGTATLLADGDTGWHLRTGEWILATAALPDRDLFSLHKAGEPWFAWEWLWDVLFGWLHQQWRYGRGGFASVIVIALTISRWCTAWRCGVPGMRRLAIATHATGVLRPLRFTGWRGRTCSLCCSWWCSIQCSNGRQEGRHARLLWLPC